MQIYINNRAAALKKGTSFDYVAENRLFSGSDGYTLNITFPLRDCPENIAIFGHIDRADVTARKTILDCEIRDRGFCRRGAVTVTEISETEVKVQFFDGRTAQNFNDTFDDIYINELDLGAAPESAASLSPLQAWDTNKQEPDFVALPWVNNASGNIQNLADYEVTDAAQGKGRYVWNADCKGRSWQPFLLWITRRICGAVGYTHDFSAWEEKEEYRYLLVCNTLPWAWELQGFARALPHWSVAEYFDKLELFLGAQIEVDHASRHVSFAFTRSMLESRPAVELKNVTEDHSSRIVANPDDDSSCDYIGLKNIAYKDCGHQMWKFYSCDWFVRLCTANPDKSSAPRPGETVPDYLKSSVVAFDTLQELLAHVRPMRSWDGWTKPDSDRGHLFYAADVDTYFLIRSLSKEQNGWEGAHLRIWPHYDYTMQLRPVNMFGATRPDDDSADTEEIELVPACIDETDDERGQLLFLDFAGYAETGAPSDEDDGSEKFKDKLARYKEELRQPAAMQILEAGEKEKKTEYYSEIYVAWWDSAYMPQDGTLPHPIAEDIEISSDWKTYRRAHFSLRLNRHGFVPTQFIHDIDPARKATFRFLSNSMPDPLAVYYIHGKRWICEKLTATFTENGMSQLIKGDFYPIKD